MQLYYAPTVTEVTQYTFDPKRVLVVEDDGPMLRTHGRVLEANGFHPVLMADPAEALLEAKGRLPSVVVVDLIMPGMSGMEFATRLRNHYGAESPPILLVSAAVAELEEAEQILFEQLLPKPYPVDALVSALRLHIGRHARRRGDMDPIEWPPTSTGE